MFFKKVLILALISSVFLLTGCGEKKSESSSAEIDVTSTPIQKDARKTVLEEKKYDLYVDSSYDLPLYSILKISKLSEFMKASVDEILKNSQGFYFLTTTEKGVFIILQNPIKVGDTYTRHDLQFVELLFSGEIIYHTAGYSGIDGEILSDYIEQNEKWIFDNSSDVKKPIKHIVYDENHKTKFVENWNYNELIPIKYQMSDSRKNVVSVLKISQDEECNLKKEHIFYDNEGKIVMSLTVNYEGPNISRLIYYNSHDSISGISLISEYQDGLKTKEYIYNEDYELMNIVISDYNEDGERNNIKLLDKESNLLEEISA